MKQHVNLYQLSFHPATPILPGTSILGACALMLSLFILTYGYAWWRLWSDTQHLESIQTRYAEEQQQVTELAKTHPPAQTDGQLAARVQVLTATREAKTHLLRLLSSRRMGNTSGFSQHIAALARQRVEGLWLREIHINHGGRKLALAGSALRAELVPRLIQLLSEEVAFAGSDFKSFRMKRSEANAREIEFAVSTNGELEP
jgi:hypothetical protein